MIKLKRGIAAKLSVLPIVAFIGFATSLAITKVGSETVARQAESIILEGERRSAELLSLKETSKEMIALVRAAPAEFDAAVLNEAKDQFEMAVQTVGGFLSTGDQEEVFQTEQLEALQDVGLQIFEFAEQFAQAQAVELVDTSFNPLALELAAYVDRVEQNNKDAAVAALAELEASQAQTNTLTIVVGAVSMAFVVGLGILLSRGLARRMRQLQEQMAQISGGDISVEVSGLDTQDELGGMARSLLVFKDSLVEKQDLEQKQADRSQSQKQALDVIGAGLRSLADGRLDTRIEAGDIGESFEAIRVDFNALMDGFGDVIATVVSSADTVRTSSAEISEVANTQSRRSEAQASTLEESAAALDGLTKSVKSAAQHASEADAAVSENRRQAEDSGDVVRRAVSAMQQIEESSSQITQIISVIDDIAFQTNLLALNAGVEAARAGESGRGFAVVASEVRALAQRASESAREIKDLISTSGQQVSEGGALVSQTGDALSEIIGRFGKVSELVSNIAVSLREQSTGLEEINVGINELDKVTQQNAAVIEETSASSQALSGEAERLSLVLSKFKLRTDTRAEAMKAAVGSDIVPEAMQTAGADTATQRAAKIYEWSSDAMQDSSPSKIDEQDWQDF